MKYRRILCGIFAIFFCMSKIRSLFRKKKKRKFAASFVLSRKLAARPLLPDDIEASARLLSSKCQKFTLVYTDKEFALRHWGVCERVQIPPWGPCSWDDVGNCPAELALQRLHCHHHEPTVHSLRGQPSDVRFRCSHQISHLGKLLSCLLLLPEWLLQGPLFFALPACSSKHR